MKLQYKKQPDYIRRNIPEKKTGVLVIAVRWSPAGSPFSNQGLAYSLVYSWILDRDCSNGHS